MDHVRLHVVGGTGGQGSARHGAMGGQGGDVFAMADPNVTTLQALRNMKRCRAEPGENGSRHSAERKGEGALH